MAEEPIKDRARSDKKSSSYRMTSFLVLSAGKTQPVSEEELDKSEAGGVSVEAELEFPEEVAKPFTAKAAASTPPLVLLWRRMVAYYWLVSYVLSYPFVRLGELVKAFGEQLRRVLYKVTEWLLLRPLVWLNKRLDAVSYKLLGLHWTAIDVHPPTDQELHDEDPLPEKREPLPPVSFLELYEMNITFTDNHGLPIFDFNVNRRIRYSLSKAVVDPVATENALMCIRECAGRAENIPPPTEGRYAGVLVAEVLAYASDADLQGFLQYVKAFPGNYIGRNLKMSETFATWVVYGAPEP